MMHNARKPGRRRLPAALVFAALDGLSGAGCSGGAPSDVGAADPDAASGVPFPDGGDDATPTEAHFPQCDRYAELDGDLYGYCIYKYAGGIPTVAAVDIYCPKAGRWDTDCRHSWVAGRMAESSGVDMELLLKVCGDNPDCTFELLDFRPADDVVVQMRRCLEYTGKHADDCSSHALQRWYHTQPDAEEVARVVAFPTPYHDKMGYWVGAAVQCQGQGACPDNQQAGTFCRNAVENFAQAPTSCPASTKQPLPHNRGRKDGGGARPSKAPRSSSKAPGSGRGRSPRTPGKIGKQGKASGLPPGRKPPRH